MKYPDDYINKILCGDCLDLMKGIPDKAVDLVLTDPPYGASYASNPIVGKNKKKSNHEAQDWDDEPIVDKILYPVVLKVVSSDPSLV